MSDIDCLRRTLPPLDEDLVGAPRNSVSSWPLERQRPVLDQLLPEAFAIVREAGKRVLMRHFDVQLLGGMAYDANRRNEDREGKTLVATCPYSTPSPVAVCMW